MKVSYKNRTWLMYLATPMTQLEFLDWQMTYPNSVVKIYHGNDVQYVAAKEVYLLP